MGKQIGKFRLKYAEFISPRISHYPEIVASLTLVIPAGGTERFEATHLGLYVVGFEVEVHSLLTNFWVGGELEKYTYLGIWETEAAVDFAALWVDRFFGGVEGCRPEGRALVEVTDIDHEVGYAAGVRAHGLSVSTRS